MTHQCSQSPSAFSAFKSALSAFLSVHQSQFIVLGAVFFILSFLGTLPYLNLVLTKTTALFIVWVLAVFLLKLSGRVSVAGALVFLGICPFLLIFGNEHLAEEAANLAFGLLAVGTAQMFIKYIKELKD